MSLVCHLQGCRPPLRGRRLWFALNLAADRRNCLSRGNNFSSIHWERRPVFYVCFVHDSMQSWHRAVLVLQPADRSRSGAKTHCPNDNGTLNNAYCLCILGNLHPPPPINSLDKWFEEAIEFVVNLFKLPVFLRHLPNHWSKQPSNDRQFTAFASELDFLAMLTCLVASVCGRRTVN